MDTTERPRRVWVRNAWLLAGALGCSALLYLFLGPAPTLDPPPDLRSLRFVDGTLTLVEDDRLAMRPVAPVDGEADEIAFAIRPADAGYFDIAHMRSHSSVALPTRIYFEERGGRYYARYKDDAPVNSSGG